MSISEKYRIVEELGGQAKRKFGKVYLIQSNETGENFILKTIQKETQNEQIQLRLRNESSFTFEADFLPKVADFFETDNELLLVLKYKEGVTLDKFWKQINKKNRVETLKKITLALIPVFEELRQKNIVHCDIKPSNILIHEKNEQLSIHLIDFGLAIRTTDSVPNKILFPLGYAAPELILNRRNCINHTSDLFSLGIVIWRLFEDKLPFFHPNPSVYTNLQITYPLPDGNETSKDLNRILKKMCYKHQFAQAPNLMNQEDVDQLLLNASIKRYQTLPEVLNDLIHVNDRKSWINRILS
ncbi:MAG: protein kinase [Crocinitomicaceae bacterium]|nr:protein kinase [Crocinitomicaceae bacterium]MCF8433752.1 protein kinase [Crocinitomicaceae bacterium]